MTRNYQTEYEKYKKRLEGVNKQKPSIKTSNLYNTLLANMAANKQAQDLSKQVHAQNLNAKAQSFVAQQQALKYTPQQLNRIGLGSTGLSETTGANIRNAYLNAIGSQDINAQNLQNSIFNQYLNAIHQNELNLANQNMQYDLEQEQLRNQEQNQYLDYYLNKLETANTPKAFDRYLEYAKQYLTPENYNALIKDLELQDFRKALVEQENLLQNQELYGISPNDQGIKIEDISSDTFGEFVGTGKGKKQDRHIERIKNFALSGHFKNGDIIDVNLGGGTNNYVYFNGRFYKTTKKANKKIVWDDDKNSGYLTNIE